MSDTIPEEITPDAEMQLQDCLEEMLRGCSKRFPHELVELIHDKAAPKFEAYKDIYPTIEERVRNSARCIGMFASAYAEFDQSAAITQAHAERAIETVARMCDALLAEAGVRGRWCPELPL